MQSLVLTYFDIAGGRAEPARLACHIGNIAFEDKRFPFSEFAEVRKHTPLLQVPVLAVDGVTVTQSNAITRYLGKLAGLYPQDNYQALLCDEIMDALEDAIVKLVATFGMQGDTLKQAREALCRDVFPLYLKLLQDRLAQAGGQYFADNRLTIADLKAMVWVRSLQSGHLDHIPTDLVSKLAPSLATYAEKIGNLSEISSYYNS